MKDTDPVNFASLLGVWVIVRMSCSHTKHSVFGVCSKLPRAIQMSWIACASVCETSKLCAELQVRALAHHSSITVILLGFLLIESRRSQVDSALEAHQHPKENVNLRWEVLLGFPESSQTH